MEGARNRERPSYVALELGLEGQLPLLLCQAFLWNNLQTCTILSVLTPPLHSQFCSYTELAWGDRPYHLASPCNPVPPSPPIAQAETIARKSAPPCILPGAHILLAFLSLRGPKVSWETFGGRPLMPARAAVSFGQLVGVCRPGVDVGWPLCDLRHLREAMSSALTTILNLHWSDGVGSLLETPYRPTHKLLMASLFLGSQLHSVHSLGCKFEGEQQPQQSHSPLMVNVTWKRLSMVGHQPCPELQSFLNRSQGSVGPRWAAAGPAAI